MTHFYCYDARMTSHHFNRDHRYYVRTNLTKQKEKIKRCFRFMLYKEISKDKKFHVNSITKKENINKKLAACQILSAAHP